MAARSRLASPLAWVRPVVCLAVAVALTGCERGGAAAQETGRDPCALLTAAEVEAVTGQATEARPYLDSIPPVSLPGMSFCNYRSTAPRVNVGITVNVGMTVPGANLTFARAAFGVFEQGLRQSGAPILELPDLGERAIWSPSHGAVTVVSHNRVLSVVALIATKDSGGGERVITERLAEKIVKRGFDPVAAPGRG